MGLWLAVIASGLFHGLNPGMGWPLAVSAGLMGRGRSDLLVATGSLAAGHLLAMLVILLPFAAILSLVEWQREIRIAAACLVIAFGVFRLIHQRHPRALARIPPSRLALWSFAIAIAHGAGLMLLPIYLGICSNLDAAHSASVALMASGLATAVVVSTVHTIAMVVAGGTLALFVYIWLGLGFISRAWINLDLWWAATLILIGGLALLKT